MKRIFKIIVFLFSCFLIIGCNNESNNSNGINENDHDVNKVVNSNSIYQNLIPFNTLINTISFEKYYDFEDEMNTKLEVPTELNFLYEYDSYIESCCYLTFNANISLDSYTELVKGYIIKKFEYNPKYHYVEKYKDENISSFSTNFQYNNNNNILKNCVKRYDLYKEDEFQKVSFIINDDNSVYILLLKNESENSETYQIEQGFIIKRTLYLENNSTKEENNNSIKFLDNLNFDETDLMKGLELYAWLENNEWRLVLLPGTNRLKRVSELKEGLILNTTDMGVLIKYYQEKEVSISIILIEELSSIISENITNEWIIDNDELKNNLKEKIGWKINLNKANYIFEEESYGLYPCVTIHDDGKFTFVFSSISSYIGYGEYVVDNNLLYLYAEDGQYWCFIIEDDQIIYDETKSNGNLWYSNIKDGSSLKLQEKEK